jgi:hypothetical protein
MSDGCCFTIPRKGAHLGVSSAALLEEYASMMGGVGCGVGVVGDLTRPDDVQLR